MSELLQQGYYFFIKPIIFLTDFKVFLFFSLFLQTLCMFQADTDRTVKRFKSAMDRGKCHLCQETVTPETMIFTKGNAYCEDCAVPRRCSFNPCSAVVKMGDTHELYCDLRPITCTIKSCTDRQVLTETTSSI